ncbi:protein-ADP-ribose hydrolase [Brachyspira sp. SAP_772]|uniref:protein-ADP-ribose hydrolase n=1 Tax=Brachyspira sp. SAP_772 TaxID=2608385 RepID=UPI0012F4AD9A|nr:protein-ADP-ribose hydrolase [Brachyspira sp. SAP_772]
MDKLLFLIDFLMKEKNYKYDEDLNNAIKEKDEEKLYNYFRCLMNIRSPDNISEEYLQIEDEYLQEKLKSKKLTSIDDIKPIKNNLYIWQGDITTLKIEAIVNAANSAMLGCFVPLHKCIDNAIHSASGTRLRLYCNDIMKGNLEKTGGCIITPAFNLPSKYVLHTVGPIIENEVSKNDEGLLYKCYKSCLETAKNNNIKSIAFCSISTGEFRFPNELASTIAVKAVRDFLDNTGYNIKIVFNVFKDLDYKLYNNILNN